MLECSSCKIEKSNLNFNRRPDRVRGFTYDCKDCIRSKDARSTERMNELRYKWALKNPAKQKYLNFKQNLKVRFGISEDVYLDMWSSQEGLCKICNQGESSKNGNTGMLKSLCVDHCHKTGRIRGLLCHKCNLGIGHLNDSIEILKSAIKYLEYRV